MDNQATTQQGSAAEIILGFLNILFKHKYKIILIFLACAAAAVVMSLRIPPIYEAESSFLIKLGREYIYRPEVGDGGPVVSFNPEGVINAEIKIIKSRDLIEKVVTALGIDHFVGSQENENNRPPENTPVSQAALAFENALTVRSLARSNMISIIFQHPDPQLAARAVNLLVDLFQEKHIQVYGNPQSEFIETQAKTYEEKLKDSERRLEAFKQGKQVFSLEEQRSLLLTQRAELDNLLKSNQNRINELQTRLSSLKTQMKSIPATKELYSQGAETGSRADSRDGLTAIRSQLLNLQLKERELLEKYHENSRAVANVRKEIELVKEFLKQQEENARKENGGNIPKATEIGENPLYYEIERDILKTEVDLNTEASRTPVLRRQMGEVEKELRSLDLREKELQSIKREFSNNEKNYQTYREKLEQVRITEDLNQQKLANIVVIEKAQVPTVPIKDPQKKKILLIGLFLGLALGFGSAYLSEFIGQGISTPESAERHLKLPVLATLPYEK